MADLAMFNFTSKSDKAESLFSGWNVSEGKNVNAKAGNDKISGATQLNGVLGLLIARAGKLRAGSGRDKIVGKSSNAHGIAIKRKASLATGNGRDHVSGIAMSQEVSLRNNGINSEGKLLSGKRKDTIKGFTNGYGGSGIYNSAEGVISTGEGDDTISGTNGYTGRVAGMPPDNTFYNRGIFSYGLINTGKGDDTIKGVSKGLEGISFGVEVFNVSTSKGDDVITGTSVSASGAGLVTWGRLNTGSGDDRIIGAGSSGIEVALGTISTGHGNDKVDARVGGFSGLGKIDLGAGNDTLVGFITDSALRIPEAFIGGKGRDKILLGDGVYRIEGGLVALASGGSFMKTNSFEKIGGVNGGLFNFADGLLTVTGGVATSLV